MTERLEQRDIQRHNASQKAYFSKSVKQTMVPRQTPYLRNQIEKALLSANIEPGMRVLEVGCGMGRYTLILAELGIRIEGLDLTPFLLEQLAKYNAGRFDLPLHCCDIIDHPARLDGQFDAVLGFFMLHHLHDLVGSFAAMAKMVKPGGQLVFVEPNAYNPLYYLQIMLTPGMTWQGDRGIVRMRPNVVFPAMQEAGLQPGSLTRFGFFPPFIANHPAGARIESFLEGLPVLKPILPFQIFSCKTP